MTDRRGHTCPEGTEPGDGAKQGEYTKDQCFLCWLIINKPEVLRPRDIDLGGVVSGEGMEQRIVANTQNGPGDKLKVMLAQMGFKTCGVCAQFAAKMDAWGVSGCKAHRQEIIDWLRVQEQNAGVMAKLRAGGLAVWHGFPLTIDGLVDEAIRQAEEDEKRGPFPTSKTATPSTSS